MGLYDVPVVDYMHAEPVAVHVADRLHVAGVRMRDNRVSGLAVVDDGQRPVGVISRTDLLRQGTVGSATGEPGRHLMRPDRTVKEVMNANPICVRLDQPLKDAVKHMRESHIHRVLVVDADGALVGLVSTWDVLMRVAEGRTRMPIEALISSSPVTARPDQKVSSAIERMGNAGVHGVVVLENEWPIGVFSQADAVQAQLSKQDDAIDDWLGAAVLTVPPHMWCFRAAALAIATGARHLVVMEQGRVTGLLTPTDLLVLS